MRIEFGQAVSREDVVRAMQIPDRKDAVPPVNLWKQQILRTWRVSFLFVFFVVGPVLYICAIVFGWEDVVPSMGTDDLSLPVSEDTFGLSWAFIVLFITLYAIWRYRIRVDRTSPHEIAKAFYRLTFLNFRDHLSPFNTKLRPVPKESFDFARSLVVPTAGTMQGSRPPDHLEQAWQQWLIMFLQHIGYPNKSLFGIGGGVGGKSSFASEIIKAPHPRVLVMSVAVGVEWVKNLGEHVEGRYIKKEWLGAGFLCVFTNVLVKIGGRWYVVGDLPPSLQNARMVR